MSAWVAASMMATGQAGALMVAIHDTPSFYTGDDLLDHHRSSPPQSPNGAVCRAYIIGVADMHRASRTGRNHPVCVPLSISQGEAQRVVVAWLRSHPLLRKGPAAFALRHALIDTWPECATNR